jgi:hypothetical protein
MSDEKFGQPASLFFSGRVAEQARFAAQSLREMRLRRASLRKLVRHPTYAQHIQSTPTTTWQTLLASEQRLHRHTYQLFECVPYLGLSPTSEHLTQCLIATLLPSPPSTSLLHAETMKGENKPPAYRGAD